MSLRILANNLKRVIAILGTRVVVNGRQPKKISRRAYVFRNATDSCRKRAAHALTVSANMRRDHTCFYPSG